MCISKLEGAKCPPKKPHPKLLHTLICDSFRSIPVVATITAVLTLLQHLLLTFGGSARRLVTISVTLAMSSKQTLNLTLVFFTWICGSLIIRCSCTVTKPTLLYRGLYSGCGILCLKPHYLFKNIANICLINRTLQKHAIKFLSDSRGIQQGTDVMTVHTGDRK